MAWPWIDSLPWAWTDALDIAILWFVVYRALVLLRGTRALQSLAGLLLAVVVYVIAGRLQLYAVHWMLEQFFFYIVLAVIILFQSDIRRGLAGAGGRFFPTLANQPAQNAMEEVVRASFAMASRRIGALIAIEREAALDDYAEGGSRLDARVSAELLLAVFHPTSPLHDGAVLLHNDRMVAAKVFLPLSLSKEVSRFYGTRHRAAIGLTEETDAVVVIVSEERGTVGLVIGGDILPLADQNEMRERLADLFAPRARARRSA